MGTDLEFRTVVDGQQQMIGIAVAGIVVVGPRVGGAASSQGGESGSKRSHLGLEAVMIGSGTVAMRRGGEGLLGQGL